MLIQFLINGIITGLIYSLASLGYAIVYNTTRIFHIAFAAIYVIGAYFFWQLTISFQLPVIIGFIISLALTSLVSLGIEKYIYFPLHKSKASLNIILVSSIGVFIVLTNVVALLWGNEPKTFSSEIGNIYTYSNLFITEKQVYQLIITIGFIISFFLFLNFSKTGLRIKAVRDDNELYQILGFSLPKIRTIAFLLSGVLIAAASCLTSWDIGMNPNIGMAILLNAVVALIIGGLGRFESCVIGGVTLGILQAVIVWKWSDQWQEAFTFLILIVFLFLRPRGFLGEKERIV